MKVRVYTVKIILHVMHVFRQDGKSKKKIEN